MVQERSFVTVLLLSIVTCGIYAYYYYYVMTRDLNTLVGDDGKSTEPSMVLLLSIVTCGFYTLYWYYDQGNRMQALAERNQIPCQENGTTYLLWILVGSLICGLGAWIAMYFFLKNYNSLANAYNASLSYNGDPNTPNM